MATEIRREAWYRISFQQSPTLQVHVGVDFAAVGVSVARAWPNEGFQAGAVTAETENGVHALSVNRRVQLQLAPKVARVQSAETTAKK